MVVQQLSVNVRRQRSVKDAIRLADISPRLQVLLVHLLGSRLQVDLGQVRDHTAEESCLDLEDRLQVLVEFLLSQIGLVCKVERASRIGILGHVNNSTAHVVHMDGVNAEVTAPQQFHLLVQVLVDGASDNTRR